MAGWSAENAPSLPSFEQQVEDIEDEVESDSSSEEDDSNEEKEQNYSLCLGADDEREDRMYSCVPWPDPDNEVDVRLLKAAVEGDMPAMREVHSLFPRRLHFARNMYGWTALHLAAFYGHAEMAVEMTSPSHFGLPPDKRNKHGWTPVMAAAWGGREEIVKYFLKDLQCSVEARDVDGRDLLHACARGGNEHLVKWFVQEFDPPLTVTKNGADVLIPAAESGNAAVFDWLFEKYHGQLDPTQWSKDNIQQPVYNALMYGKMELAQHIVRKYGADLNTIVQNGPTLMSCAVIGGSMEAIAWLTEEYHMDIRSYNDVLGSALHYACLFRHQELVQYLLTLGLDPMAIDKSGKTCLLKSICEGPVAIVKDLLSHNACRITRVQSQIEQPAVVLAAAHGQKEVLEFLLDNYQNLCSPQDKSRNGDTPLLMAVQKGHLAVVKMLIEKYKCSANATFQSDDGPVIVASRQGHLAILKLLVEKYNGDTLQVDTTHTNALHWAAFGGHLACVKYLAAKLGERKFDLNVQGESCLHRAVEGGSVRVVRYLIDKCGLDPKLSNGSSLDCLMLACCHGRRRIVCDLIEKYNMNQHMPNEIGKTPLHYAASNGHRDCMKLLVHQYKFDPDKADARGQTVLHASCLKGDVEMVRFILEQFNPNLEAMNKDGRTPLHCACLSDSNSAAVVRVLAKDYHANMDVSAFGAYGAKPLHVAAVKCNLDAMRILITECGCKADLRDLRGLTALHLSASRGHLDALKALVKEFKLDPNAVDKEGHTPMMAAAEAGEIDSIRVLVKELGCNKDAQDKNGLTAVYHALRLGPAVLNILLNELQCNPKLLPITGETLLHGCALYGYPELLKDLVTQHNLDVNQKDTGGETALHTAARAGQISVIKQLKELNCDISICNKMGLTAVDMALHGGKDTVVAALLD